MREFLYLNESLVDQFLAQVEDGLWEEQQEREKRTGDKKGGGSIGAKGLKVEGSMGSGREIEESRTRRQTPESRFNRLAKLAPELPDGEFLQIEDDTRDLYGILKPGLLIATECYVDIPSVGRAVAKIEEVKGLVDFMTIFGSERLDPGAQEAIDGISAFAERAGGDIICTGEIGDDLPILVFKLKSEYLRVDVSDLEGDAVILANVHRKWPEGDSYPILTVPGLDVMSRKDRRKMKATAKKTDTEDNDVFLEGPGITLSVVAIFRGAL